MVLLLVASAFQEVAARREVQDHPQLYNESEGSLNLDEALSHAKKLKKRKVLVCSGQIDLVLGVTGILYTSWK